VHVVIAAAGRPLTALGFQLGFQPEFEAQRPGRALLDQ
jgi:hypothetical protein